MKGVIIVIVSILFLSEARSQIFHPKDSIRKEPILQFGVGGYMGTHNFVPQSSGFTHQNQLGYDKGLLLRFKLNIFKNLSVSTDARYIKRSGMVDLKNQIFTQHFYVTMSGIQLPFVLNYVIKNRKQSEILAFFSGIAFNQMIYQLSSDHYLTFQNTLSTNTPFQKLNGSKQNYFSLLAGFSKTFQLSNQFEFIVFNEYEFKNQALSFTTYLYNLNSNLNEKYKSTYNSLSIKIGICLIY